MARKVAGLEQEAFALAAGVFTQVPRQYLDKPPTDSIGRAWRDAVHKSMATMASLERLGDLLRAKAGIAEPGPLVALFEERNEDDGVAHVLPEPDADSDEGAADCGDNGGQS